MSLVVEYYISYVHVIYDRSDSILIIAFGNCFKAASG